MGVERLRAIAQSPDGRRGRSWTPVALVRWGTTTRQESLEGTLATIADLVEKRGFAAPAVTVVGDVVKLRSELNWYEALPLFGQRVVVTRTRRQASVLSEKLRLLGADVLEIATIRVVPLPLDDLQRKKLAALSQHFDWIVFTSPNAVELFFEEFFKTRIRSTARSGRGQICRRGPGHGEKEIKKTPFAGRFAAGNLYDGKSGESCFRGR